MPEGKTVKFVIRLDENLYRQLTAAAKQALRSVNSEMLWRLRKSLEQSGGR